MSEEKQQLLVDNGFEESSSETTQVTPRYFPGITGFFPIHYSQNAVKCLGIVQIVIGIVCLILLCKSVVLCDDRSLVGYYAAIFEGIVVCFYIYPIIFLPWLIYYLEDRRENMIYYYGK